MGRFIVVGDLMTDVVARVLGPITLGTDTPTKVDSYGGGSGANVAAWLGRQGEDVVYVGRRGPDVVGRTREMELLGYGIDSRVVMDQTRPTGTCVVLVSPTGERSVFPDPGANAALSPEDVPAHLFGGDVHVHVSGYPIFHEGGRDGALTALRYAVERGLSCSVDAASATMLERMGGDTFLSYISGATLLLANKEESRFLSGEHDAYGAARALTKHFPHVVVKDGAHGAVWCSAGENPVHVDPPRVKVLDPTGAGDAFCAGMLARWRAGARPADALTAGCRLAAQVLTQAGARPAD